MLNEFSQAFLLLSDISVVMFLVLGCFIGVVFGLIPGLGGIQALVMVLPFTFWLDPAKAMYIYAGIMGSVGGAGAVTAILINTPGTAPNITSTFDGYPMTLKGEGVRAISMSTIGAIFGELLALLFVVCVLPLVKVFILAFGSGEIFWVIMLGVAAISAVSTGNALKGIAAGGIGFLLSFVGFSELGNVERYTFGSEYLWQGIPLVPFFMGAFAVPQIVNFLSGKGAIATNDSTIQHANVLSQLGQGFRDVIKHWFTVIRSAAIGLFVGIIPGVGGLTSTFLAYYAEVQSSKDKSKFGKGAPQGLIASDSSIHATHVGDLLTTIALGIPGGVEMAVFLGVLIMHGLQPGPQLISEHSIIVWTLIVGLALAQLISSAMIFSSAWWFHKLTRLETKYLGAPLAIVVFIGCYAINGSIWDVGLALVAGICSWVLTRFGYSIATLSIGFILGNMLETSFHQTLMISYGSYLGFVSSWLSIVLMLLVIFAVLWPIFSKKRGNLIPGGSHYVED